MPRYQILIDRSFKRPVHEVFGALADHNGQMQFESTNTGSRLRWQIDCDMPPVIDSIVRTVLMRTLKRGLRKLA
jgi:carbon monoxide dehydrogenase subunit G